MKELRVTTFGEFSISYGENRITEADNRKKKVWSLLQYLITFRARNITQDELIEMFWPEEGVDDPANTLKTLLFRVRALLKTLGFEEVKRLIVAQGGSYAWNREVPCVIDAADFDRLLEEAGAPGVSPAEQLRKLLAAAELYKGAYLPLDSASGWLVPVSAYYRAKYLKAITDACGLFAQSGRYEESVALCQKAVGIDPYEESLHYTLLAALIKDGRYQQALAYYYYVKDLFYSKFGLNLSEEFRALYKETVKSSKLIEHDLNLIMEKLREAEAIKGAFYCEYEFFKDVYRLEIRTAERTGLTVYLGLLTLSGKNELLPSPRTMNQAMELLRRVINKSLRKGDIFTRYSINQYLLMLPMTTYKSANNVIERIRTVFGAKNTKTPLILNHSHHLITPPKP